MKRRDVLKIGGLAAAALGARTTAVEAQTRQDTSLPPSIAALSSMRGLARPITNAEREARLEKARRLMVASKLDAMLLTGGTSLAYFTGLRWGNSERLMALVVPARGDAFVVCPAFEVDRLNEQLRQSPLRRADIRSWQETRARTSASRRRYASVASPPADSASKRLSASCSPTAWRRRCRL